MKKYVPILSLHPTQLAVGMLEVDEKIAMCESQSRRDLEHYIDDTPVPVVRAPNGELYVVDHHHFLSVCYHLGIKKVRIKIVKDFLDRKMTYRQFWKQMRSGGRAYLYCQFGNGPHREFYLPRDIRGLADDPYRSLAWFVRKAGGYKNSGRNFAEFSWANYFRSKKLFNRKGLADFENVLMRAIDLSQSEDARKLPGYRVVHESEQASIRKRAENKIKKYRKRFAERAIVARF